jgi:hypothetical protein
MPLRWTLVVDDKLGVTQREEAFSIAISTFSVDEHDEMHFVSAVFHHI